MTGPTNDKKNPVNAKFPLAAFNTRWKRPGILRLSKFIGSQRKLSPHISVFPNTLRVILEQLQDTQAVLLLYFVIRFNCSSLCWLYKYYDKTSESSLCLNTAEQFECNYSARPRESESKHFKRQREQSAEVRYTVPQPCKSLLFPLHKSIRRIASPSYERRTLSSLWLWLWSMTKEKVENEKQSERNVCVWWRTLCVFVLAG